jgi:dGTPase
MDWADDVTYAVHDVEDFFRVGLVPLDRLGSDGPERTDFLLSFYKDDGALRDKFSDLTPAAINNAIDFLFDGAFTRMGPFSGSQPDRVALKERSSFLIGRYITEFTVRSTGRVSIPLGIRAEVAALKELAWYYIIDSPSLATLHHGQERVIAELHEIYRQAAEDSSDWNLFPRPQQEMLAAAQDMRVVTDMVAELTEDMSYELYHRLTGIARGSLLDSVAMSGR